MKRRIWVIKVGSSLLADPRALGSQKTLKRWLRVAKQLRQTHGVDVVWVSSGAIRLGRGQAAEKSGRATDLAHTQALSAIGQPALMALYQAALPKGETCAQVLLIADDLRHRRRRALLVRTLRALLRMRVLPILNENDAVSTEEIEFGDNDRLSARVAAALNAERLVLLTDIDALRDAQGQPVAALTRIGPRELGWAQALPKKGDGGKGGMLSKLLSAAWAKKQGVDVWILSGRGDPARLIQLARDPSQLREGTRVSASAR